MKLGYLHIGSPEHGVCRYGRLLATEARGLSTLSVIEAEVELTLDHRQNRAEIIKAARHLSSVDIVHLQYSIKNNKGLWGLGWTQLTHLRLFRQYCAQPLVVTLHDVYDLPPNPSKISGYVSRILHRCSPNLLAKGTPNKSLSQAEKLSLANLLDSIRQYRWLVQGEILRIPGDISLYWLLRQVKLVFVSSEEERRRLSQGDIGSTTVIPHFVEQRSPTLSKKEAQQALNLHGFQVITLLGFIHERKGHQLLLKALSQLPEQVIVVFAGGASPGNEHFLKNLLALAKTDGVEHRLRITDYLSEVNLERYLMATDLAVCPFQSFAASGSLSTWISVGRSLLAFNLPQIAEYNRIEPDSIKTFQPYTPEALASEIKHLLSAGIKAEDIAVDRLKQRLLLPVTFNQHLVRYQQVVTALNKTIVRPTHGIKPSY